MKKLIMISLITLALSASCVFAADIRLPEPRTEGGPGVFTALKARASAPGSSFPGKALSQEELSTVLWAATGLNRSDKWTVPMAMGAKPYCKVYVADEKGAYLYDWENNLLRQITDKNIKGDVGKQEFVKNAPQMLLFVIDGKANLNQESFGYVAVGAMTQNVYLAAAGLNAGTRYIASIDADKMRQHLKLDAKDIPVCVMALGKE